MGEHHEKHTIFGPFPDTDPLDTARLFLRTNRYQIVLEETGPTPDAMEVDPSVAAPIHEDPGENKDENENENENENESAGENENENESAGENENESADEDESENEDQNESAGENENESAGENENESADEDESEDANENEYENDEIVLTLRATRGERWSGLTSSNMADLETTIDLAIVANSIQVRYTVNTTGQLLNDDERRFWGREAKALEAFVTGGDLVSVVADESSRATRARRDLLGQGMWIGAVVFVAIFILGVLYVRFA